MSKPSSELQQTTKIIQHSMLLVAALLLQWLFAPSSRCKYEWAIFWYPIAALPRLGSGHFDETSATYETAISGSCHILKRLVHHDLENVVAMFGCKLSICYHGEFQFQIMAASKIANGFSLLQQTTHCSVHSLLGSLASIFLMEQSLPSLPSLPLQPNDNLTQKSNRIWFPHFNFFNHSLNQYPTKHKPLHPVIYHNFYSQNLSSMSSQVFFFTRTRPLSLLKRIQAKLIHPLPRENRKHF